MNTPYTISQKTLEDLEFPIVRKHLALRCHTEMGKELAVEIQPETAEERLFPLLQQTSEYLSSFENENRIPNHGFDSIREELKLLQIENTSLEITGFRRIAQLCTTVVRQKRFLKKFQEYYPQLFILSEAAHDLSPIPNEIEQVVDRFGEVKDSASPNLRHIRAAMSEVRSKINSTFGSAMQRYVTADFLDDIKESVVENRRVLAVKAMYRKKVKGSVLGSSKTGSIVYIIPEATLQHTRALSQLEFEEQEEIQRILKELTNFVRPYREVLDGQQYFLARIDLTAAKARYAEDLNAILPEINKEQQLTLKEAYHPLLYLSNKQKGHKTWPQTIALHRENRIIVISGPNAGGKSITLKTIGLLQIMLQSGLLIPVHPRSKLCLFQKVLTDIGDNQSIENHLSTYSYRLKNMRSFLKQCDPGTLFLIDEFGTGSDPELGGALAEAFLEVFYERGSFGVITTHYSNLKMLANELPHATNANMLFDGRTLEPTFQLVLGEAGSSFTFEVAQKNGIPYSLINKAKKKIERGKVRFDATIAKLQKERHKVSKTGNRLQEEESKAREEAEKLEKLNVKIKSKLESYQELYDHHQRMILLGNKLNDAAERYFRDNKKRQLIGELLRIVETENSKRKKKSAQEAKAEKKKKEVATQEIQKEVKEIREKKKKAEKKEKTSPAPPKKRPVFKVGDRVRLFDGKTVGSIDSLEKGKAVVNYGLFTTHVSIEQLELVESA